MKPYVALLLFAFVVAVGNLSAKAQTTNTLKPKFVYCELVWNYKSFKNQITVTIDFGEKNESMEERTT